MDEARGNLWDALEQVMAYHREEARKHAVPGAVREELKLAVEVFVAKGATRQSATEDVLWALLNSAEFVFNH